ncbi:hypothetical protein [Microbaculum sp. FT89]|uniref:hypothetical protein n=1 Tax=Microbaculum sp. FT89 TaxID=3447298 RepID=UPI003F531153
MNDSGVGGELSGLKHTQAVLIAAIGIVGAGLWTAFFYQASRIDGLSLRVDAVVDTQGDMRADIAVIREKASNIEQDIFDMKRDIAEIKQFLIPASAPPRNLPRKVE